MLRRSNPPSPLGPTTAHLAASTFMALHANFPCVFALSLYECHDHGFRGLQEILHASDVHALHVRLLPRQLWLALRLRPYACPRRLCIFAERGAESAGHGEGGSHRTPEWIGRMDRLEIARGHPGRVIGQKGRFLPTGNEPRNARPSAEHPPARAGV